jgi:hypothetical protein
MQWAFYRIPVTGGAASDELNRFLRSVRVLTVHREEIWGHNTVIFRRSEE